MNSALQGAPAAPRSGAEPSTFGFVLTCLEQLGQIRARATGPQTPTLRPTFDGLARGPPSRTLVITPVDQKFEGDGSLSS